MEKKNLCFALLVWFAAGFSAVLLAEENKSGFHFLKPVPTELMRELSTDRPDKTESAYTVDAGHFQIEADFVDFSYDRHNAAKADVKNESFSFATLNLKAGLLHNLDVQLVVPTYNFVRTDDRTTGVLSKQSGFGDLAARAKLNLWGNDGGKTAFAIMPFLKLPTNQDGLGNHAVEGGVIFPIAVELPADWSMGLMTEIDFNEDAGASDYHPEFVNSITFSHSIFRNLGGYAEFFSNVSSESGSDWVGTADFGLVYALAENVQLDGGINIGVTRSADDFNPFAGITVRF